MSVIKWERKVKAGVGLVLCTFCGIRNITHSNISSRNPLQQRTRGPQPSLSSPNHHHTQPNLPLLNHPPSSINTPTPQPAFLPYLPPSLSLSSVFPALLPLSLSRWVYSPWRLPPLRAGWAEFSSPAPSVMAPKGKRYITNYCCDANADDTFY